MSQKEIKRRIAELKIIKRSGMMRAIIAFIAMVVLIAVYLSFKFAGAEWANSSFGYLALWICAIIAAAIAGLGTREWKRAKDEMVRLQKKLK